jgi:hypothetical protein
MNMRIKIYTRLISVIIFLLTLSLKTFSQPPPVTSIGATSLTAGTYSVPITVTGFNNVGNISLSLNYNPGELVYTGFILNNALISANAIATPVTDQSGAFRFSYVSGTPINLGAPAGTLITLTFTAQPGVQGVRSLLTWSKLQGACEITPPSPGAFVPPITVSNMSTYFIDGFIDIMALFKTLNLTLFLEGLYTSGSMMNQSQGSAGNQFPGDTADEIKVELHSSVPGQYATVVYSASNVNLSAAGQASVSIPSTFMGSYYVTIRHRNSITTVSASPISFAGDIITWNFSTSAEMAYGNRLRNIGGIYVLYGGDVNQDGVIDTNDFIGVDNDSFNYATGYLDTDVDGDGVIDTRDFITIDNNNYNYIQSAHP